MLNKVILIGRITKDPELRKTQSGASVVSFTLACNRRNKQEGQPDADFINCVVWNKVAEAVEQHVTKGELLGISGRIQTRNYDDRNGRRVYVTEVLCDSVQFLESKKASTEQAVANTQSYNTLESDLNSVDSLDIASDDLPF